MLPLIDHTDGADRSAMARDFLTPLALVAAAAALRLVPHPPNFTPIGALALFAGATFRSRRWAVAAPLVAMLISDFWLGFHPYMPVVYGCMLLNVGLGCWVRRTATPTCHRAKSAACIAGSTLVGATIFFLATNFAVWIAVYDPTWSTLVACYTAAIPFFRYTLAGDFVFTAGLFSAYAICCRWLASPRPAAVH